ncbi:MAG: hypothetical protein ACT4O0_05120 [Pseudonocardia sp.]
MGITQRPPAATEARRPVSSIGEDLTTGALGLWLIVGLFTDGWAHLHMPGLETFFTPWHGLLYSGFAASAGWIGLLAARGHRRGWAWRLALPMGYSMAAAGAVIFGVAGFGDMVWHVVRGVESGIDALLSPTHLMLLAGAALLLTAPLRSGWARPSPPGRPSLRNELPAAVSLSLVTALAAFFLLYASVFAGPAASAAYVRVPEGAPGHHEAEAPIVIGVVGYLVTTVLLIVPLLLAERLERRPRGLVVVLVSTVAWLSAGANGFTDYGLSAAISVTFAAAVSEFVVEYFRRVGLGGPMRLMALGATVPILLWTAQLIAVELVDGLSWPAELWSGVVVLSALVGAVLGSLVGWAPQSADRIGTSATLR